MDVSEEAAPLIFTGGKDSFRYSLFDAMQMKSANQFRLYELMKEHSSSGVFLISVDKLRWMLDLGPRKPNSLWGFSRDVIETSRESISQRTDINFEYSGVFKGDEWEASSILFTVEDKSPFFEPDAVEAFLDENSKAIDQALRKFMEDFSEARGISESFYDTKAVELFFEFMKRALSGLGELSLERKRSFDKDTMVVKIKGKSYWIEIRRWRDEDFENRSVEKLFSFVKYHRQRVGWLLSFCPKVNPGVRILTLGGRRILEAVV
jgi:plasmid replication initiation protein